MKGKRAMVLLLVLALLLCGCAARKTASAGRYKAVNPPVESGETVIQELVFDGAKVTMISGSISQTVDYTIQDGTFTINTKYGSFSYAYEEKTDGTLVIDGVDYARQ